MTWLDDLPPDDPQWYSSSAYRDALVALKAAPSVPQRRMLIAHAMAPDLMLSVHQLAAAAGYARPNVAYSQYGRLGHAIADALGYRPEDGIWTRAIARGWRSESGDVVWEMEPSLARALISIDWVSRVTTPDVFDEINAADGELSGSSETEKRALILARIGQGPFRSALLRLHGACMVSGVTEPVALRASHIRPWRSSSNADRVNTDNGLLLSAHYDALFDAGLLSFDDVGRVLVSDGLAARDRARLGITGSEQLSSISEGMSHFLEYHRSHVFRHH